MIKLFYWFSNQFTKLAVFFAKAKLRRRIKKDLKDPVKASEYRSVVEKIRGRHEAERLRSERNKYLRNSNKKFTKTPEIE